MEAMAIEEVIFRIVIGIVIGLVCKIASGWLEKYILDKRNLEVQTSKLENVIVLSATMIAGAVIMIKFQLTSEIVYAFFILIICITISLIDLHHRIIPNGLLLAMLLAKVCIGIPGLFDIAIFPKWNIWLSLIGLVAGFIVFAIPGAFGKAVGAGDVKLAACTGFCLGIDGLLYSVILMGLGVLAFSIVQKNKTLRNMMYEMIPMGPFLAMGMLVVMLVI